MYFLASPKSTTYTIWACLPIPIKKLSGFMSLCSMCLSCMASIRYTNCSPTCSTVLKDSLLPCYTKRSYKEVPSRSISITLYCPSVVTACTCFKHIVLWECRGRFQKSWGTCTVWPHSKVVGTWLLFIRVWLRNVIADWCDFKQDRSIRTHQCQASWPVWSSYIQWVLSEIFVTFALALHALQYLNYNILSISAYP